MTYFCRPKPGSKLAFMVPKSMFFFCFVLFKALNKVYIIHNKDMFDPHFVCLEKCQNWKYCGNKDTYCTTWMPL